MCVRIVPADVAADHKAIVVREVAYASRDAAFPRVNLLRRCLFPLGATARCSGAWPTGSRASRQRCQTIDVTSLVSKSGRSDRPRWRKYASVAVILDYSQTFTSLAINTQGESGVISTHIHASWLSLAWVKLSDIFATVISLNYALYRIEATDTVTSLQPMYKISYDLSQVHLQFIVRSTYITDLQLAKISRRNIVS